MNAPKQTVLPPVDMNGILICLGSKVNVLERSAVFLSYVNNGYLVREKQGEPWLWNGYDFVHPLSKFFTGNTSAGAQHSVSIS